MGSAWRRGQCADMPEGVRVGDKTDTCIANNYLHDGCRT